MFECVDDTIGGFNSFLKTLEPDSLVSVNLFDHEYTELYKKKASKAEPLTKETYIPRGNTALYDAIGKTAAKVSEIDVTFVILTDGDENSSREFTKKAVRALIEEKTKLGWTFVYMGANQDACFVAEAMGINRDGALTFTADRVESAISSVSQALTRSRTQGTPVSFTQDEREYSVGL